jgi:phosphoribosyl 1,2-cyclic phosphodiesterase
LGYASDLGEVRPEFVAAMANVTTLALEFNHDPWLEQASGRPAFLVSRVLGANGHLSNQQGAQGVAAILAASTPQHDLRHVIQLHLSRDCNKRDRAQQAMIAVAQGLGATFELITAYQHKTMRLIDLEKSPTPETRQASMSQGECGEE